MADEFPYQIRWDAELRAEVRAVKRRGAFRGYLAFDVDPKPVVPVRVFPTFPCPRCGISRQAKKASSLCKDCVYSLSKEERALWAA